MNFDETDKNFKNHPKRLEEDTANYLLSIEANWDDSKDEEEINILIENVLEEIKTRTASAACDRRTHPLIEKICCVSSLTNVLILLERFSPYALFLSRNRHSSHILQTVFSRYTYLMRTTGCDDTEAEQIKNSMISIISPIIDVFYILNYQIIKHTYIINTYPIWNENLGN